MPIHYDQGWVYGTLETAIPTGWRTTPARVNGLTFADLDMGGRLEFRSYGSWAWPSGNYGHKSEDGSVVVLDPVSNWYFGALPIGTEVRVAVDAAKWMDEDGSKVLEVWGVPDYPILVVPSTDPVLDLTNCVHTAYFDLVPSALPAWDARLTRHYKTGYGKEIDTALKDAWSIGGYKFYTAVLEYGEYFTGYWTLWIWMRSAYHGVEKWPEVVWRGKKPCQDSYPAGVYAKWDGCSTTASITLECPNP